MNRTYVLLGMVTLFGATTFACSEDETTTTTSTTTNQTTTTSTTTGMGGSTTSTTTGMGGMGMGGMAMGGMGMGGEAASFCDQYEMVCGFGETGRYADAAACTDYTGAASAACQTCLDTHLGLAATMQDDQAYLDTHCPHGCGEGPCAADCDPNGCQ